MYDDEPLDPITKEIIRVNNLELPLWCSRLAWFELSVARFLRIGFALGICRGAWWLGSISIEIFGKPFAALSPLELFGGLLAGMVALCLIALAYFVAFGEQGTSRVETRWRESQADQKKLLGYD